MQVMSYKFNAKLQHPSVSNILNNIFWGTWASPSTRCPKIEASELLQGVPNLKPVNFYKVPPNEGNSIGEAWMVWSRSDPVSTGISSPSMFSPVLSHSNIGSMLTAVTFPLHFIEDSTCDTIYGPYYDPQTRTWSLSVTMSQPPTFHYQGSQTSTR